MIIDMGNVGSSLYDQFDEIRSPDYGRMELYEVSQGNADILAIQGRLLREK